VVEVKEGWPVRESTGQNPRGPDRPMFTYIRYLRKVDVEYL